MKTTDSDFSGRVDETSSNESDVWKRRPAEVGLNFFNAMAYTPSKNSIGFSPAARRT